MESAFGFISVPSAAASSVELPHHFVFSGVTNDATADKTGSGGAKFFLQNQRPICAAKQTVCSGDHIEPIFRLLLARMVYQKQTDSQLFGKRFQFADNLIIAGIAAFFVSGFPNLLQRVDNNKVCIRVFPAKGLDLLVKSAAQRLCCIGKVERGRNICTEHTIKPLLQSLLIVLQSQIENRSLLHRKIPEWFSAADMKGKLRHEK